MLNIVFLDRETFPADIEIPRPAVPHQWHEYSYTPKSKLPERIGDADIIITNKVMLDAEALSLAPRLKMVAISATGVNNIDLAAASAHGITVCNVRDYAQVTVPEHVLSFIFALKRNLAGWIADQKQKRWASSRQFCAFNYRITDVRGSTLGIVGRGSLGRATGALAHAVGMQVLYAERPEAEFVREGYTAFSDVLAQADVLSLHCPLTEQTTKLMNDKTLSAMKAGALLINTGRGALVDEAALLRALDSGHLGGAALDVLSEEPPKADHPLLVAAAQRNNLLITPHVAWASDSAIREVLAQVVHNIEAYVARKPQNVVTL